MLLHEFGAYYVQDFQRNILFLPSQHWEIVVIMLCPWARHFTFKCFTSLRCKCVPGGTEMAIVVRQITSATSHGCNAVCCPGSWKWYMNEQI